MLEYDWVAAKQAQQEAEDRAAIRAAEKQRLIDIGPLKMAVLIALREKRKEDNE